VNPECGAVYWPNAANLDSEVLYATIIGVPIPEYAAEKT
jgi:hypothetical protein